MELANEDKKKRVERIGRRLTAILSGLMAVMMIAKYHLVYGSGSPSLLVEKVSPSLSETIVNYPAYDMMVPLQKRVEYPLFYSAQIRDGREASPEATYRAIVESVEKESAAADAELKAALADDEYGDGYERYSDMEFD